MIKNHGFLFIFFVITQIANPLAIKAQYINSGNIDSLRFVIDTTKNITIKADAYLKLAQYYQNINKDSAVRFLPILDSLAKLANNSEFNVTYFSFAGNLQVEMGAPFQGIDYLMQALTLTETKSAKLKGEEYYKNLLQIGNLYSSLGIAYWHKSDFNKSKELFRKTLSQYEIIEKEAPSLSNVDIKIRALNNLGSVYNKMNDYENALEYYLLALNLYPDQANVIPQLFNNIAICYKEKGQPEKAYHYYILALESAEKKNMPTAKIQIYNNLGRYFLDQNELDKAELNLEKASSLEKNYPFPYSRAINLEFKSTLYEKRNNIPKAYQYYKSFISLRDSLENIQSSSSLAQLEREYEFEKQKRETQFEKERLDAQQNRREFIVIIILIIAVSASIIFILLFVLQKTKLQRLSLEQKQTQVERDAFESELSYKNKELTTNVMYLVRKNELIQKIAEKLLEIKKDLKQSNQDPIQQIIHELQNSLDNDVWKEFEYRFQDVHEEFYQKLNELFPDLSPNEKKLCAFLRLNMSTKEISAITFQTPHSITIARSRLRKKLNISNTDTNLTDFLMSL